MTTLERGANQKKKLRFLLSPSTLKNQKASKKDETEEWLDNNSNKSDSTKKEQEKRDKQANDGIINTNKKNLYFCIAMLLQLFFVFKLSGELISIPTTVLYYEQVVPPTKKYAIATFVDSYNHMLGLYSIARQAKNTGMVSEGIDIVVGISEQFLNKKENFKIKHIMAQWKDEGLIHKTYVFDNYIIAKRLTSGMWVGTFNKLFFFNLTDYDKLIQLDADVLIRHNIRNWFDYDTPCAIQANDYLEWNSGAMVITPNQTVFEDMLTILPNSTRIDGLKKFNPRTVKHKVNLTEPDNWNSQFSDQGFVSSYFTTSSDASLRMKTMPTENAILISSLQRPQYHYFWYRRNHIFDTIHLTKAKPWLGRYNDPIVCDVLREWNSSVAGLERYNMTIKNNFLRRCR